MINIGKTPLIRARKLEEKLGVKKIYLKLEGNNPTRSFSDRLAKIIVKYAKTNNQNTIIIDGSKNLIKAIKDLAKSNNLILLVPQFKRENWKEKLLDKKILVNLSGISKTDVESVLLKLSLDNNALYVDKQLIEQLSSIAYEQVVNEITIRYPEDIDSLFFNAENEIAYESYQSFLLKRNLTEDYRIPKLYGAVPEGHGNDRLDFIEPDEETIEEAYELLQKQEHLKIQKQSSLAFAALLKTLREDGLKDGRHVVILDTARSRVKVQQLEDFNDLTKMELLDYVDNYLDRYSDSKTEAVEAIEQALENGFILTAKREDEIDGVCIIVHMGFEDFIPTYHLAYIGINPNSKGRGIGSELIKEAINLTNGKISLHVDLDNKNAKRLYKKMGFKHVYDRMIYQNQEK
jgi:threonine synthase